MPRRKIKHLPSKKAAHKEKLKGLIVEEISDGIISVIGRCGEAHLVCTALTREANEILAGEFLTSPVDPNKIILCVGRGEICSKRTKDREVLWFLSLDDRGVHCISTNNLQQLKEDFSHMELAIV